MFRAPTDMPLLKIAEQIRFTTKAVEVIIAHRLEDIKAKLKSMSELEITEKKINRRLTTHRNSRRSTKNRHRHSRIHEYTDFADDTKVRFTTYKIKTPISNDFWMFF